MTDVRTNGAHVPEKIPGDNTSGNAGEKSCRKEKILQICRSEKEIWFFYFTCDTYFYYF